MHCIDLIFPKFSSPLTCCTFLRHLCTFHLLCEVSKSYLTLLNLTPLAALPTLYCPVFEDLMAKSTLIHASLQGVMVDKGEALDKTCPRRCVFFLLQLVDRSYQAVQRHTTKTSTFVPPWMVTGNKGVVSTNRKPILVTRKPIEVAPPTSIHKTTKLRFDNNGSTTVNMVTSCR